MFFDFIKTTQGRLVFAALFLLVFCVAQSKDANKFINEYNEENSDNYNIKKLPTAPYGSLISIIVLLALALILPLG